VKGLTSIQRFFKHTVVDAFVLALNLLFVWVLVESGLYYLWAVAIAFFLASILSYVGNRTWTFDGVVSTSPLGGYMRAFVVAIAVLCFIEIMMWLAVEYLGLNYLVARALIAIIAGLCGYVLDAAFSFGVPRTRFL